MVERGKGIARGHRLLDQETRQKLPELYRGEKDGVETKALVKFFTPDSNWTWYASEFDGEDIFFGLVSGFEVELGYFSLSELEEVRGPLGLPIERDLYYKPRTLKDLLELHRRERQGIHEVSGSEEYRCQLINKLSLLGYKLAQWDKRVIKIAGIGDIAKGQLGPETIIQLVCTFSPEPNSQSEGFFSIANPIVRNDYEGVSEELGIVNSIDLGFKVGEKICLPNGEVKDMPTDQIRVWPVYNYGKQPR